VDGFGTRGAAYFNISELRRLAQSLLAFPLPEQPRLKIAGGFFSKSNPPVLEHELLSMEFYRVGSRGQVGVRVHGETEIWEGDRPESRNDATVELLTSYARLAAFSHELTELLAGARKEAILQGEKLAWAVAQLQLAPDANRCFTVLQGFSLSRAARAGEAWTVRRHKQVTWNLRRTVVITISAWLLLVFAVGYSYVRRMLAIPPSPETYTNTASFQVFAFCYALLPIFLVVLAVILVSEVLVAPLLRRSAARRGAV
jgi:hypothetical protein